MVAFSRYLDDSTFIQVSSLKTKLQKHNEIQNAQKLRHPNKCSKYVPEDMQDIRQILTNVPTQLSFEVISPKCYSWQNVHPK